MAKGFPLKVVDEAEAVKAVERLSADDLRVSGDAKVLDITDFKEEMEGCVELDEELERYFRFLNNLSRADLLAIVKYEVYNRVLMQQGLDLSLEKTDE